MSEDKGSCYLVRPDVDRILVTVRSAGDEREHSVSIPWDVWLKMIHGHGKVEALIERDRLRSVLKSLLSCAEHWYKRAEPSWDGSAKSWSAIGEARAITAANPDQK